MLGRLRGTIIAHKQNVCIVHLFVRAWFTTTSWLWGLTLFKIDSVCHVAWPGIVRLGGCQIFIKHAHVSQSMVGGSAMLGSILITRRNQKAQCQSFIMPGQNQQTSYRNVSMLWRPALPCHFRIALLLLVKLMTPASLGHSHCHQVLLERLAHRRTVKAPTCALCFTPVNLPFFLVVPFVAPHVSSHTRVATWLVYLLYIYIYGHGNVRSAAVFKGLGSFRATGEFRISCGFIPLHLGWGLPYFCFYWIPFDPKRIVPDRIPILAAPNNYGSRSGQDPHAFFSMQLILTWALPQFSSMVLHLF